MINDRDRIKDAFEKGLADAIIKDGSYYLVKDGKRTYIHDKTFANVRSILQEVSKNKWILK